MSQGLYLTPVSVTSVAAAAATATSSAINVGIADEYSILINCTAATGTSPTMDVVFQTSFDKGTTYANMPLRSAQLTAAGVHWFTFRRGCGWGEAAFNQALVADTGGALAKNVVFDPQYVKFKYTIGGTNPAFTFKVCFFIAPRGSNGAV
jgi:hypothetical protein